MSASDRTAKSPGTPRIAVSYRRNDSKAAVTLICNHLTDCFGSDKVFRDLDSIRAGTNFRQAIESAFRDCDVVLAVIGHDWAGRKQDGTQRIHATNDFVRIEIECALRFEKALMPVLLDGACMPEASHLPDSIKKLADLQAVDIDTGRRFRYDANRLVDDIRAVISAKAEEEAREVREAKQRAEAERKAEEQARAAREAEQRAEAARKAEEQARAAREAERKAEAARKAEEEARAARESKMRQSLPSSLVKTQPEEAPSEPWYARYLNLHKPREPLTSFAPSASTSPVPSKASAETPPAASSEDHGSSEETESHDAGAGEYLDVPTWTRLRSKKRKAVEAQPEPKPAVAPPVEQNPAHATASKPSESTTTAESRGRFRDTDPTLVTGEDLDVPTWMRLRGRTRKVDAAIPANVPSSPPAPAGPEASEPPAPAAESQKSLHVPKVGRNDPCPCGSGHKFKRCCGRISQPPVPSALVPGGRQASSDLTSASPSVTTTASLKKETVRITLRARPTSAPPPP